MAENTLQLIVGWELVGVCSFALIGHWWEEKPNSDAALKAFLTNRVGDVGLLVGVIILFFAAGGTFDIITINEMAVEPATSATPGCCWSPRCCLIAAVMSKSGQFILHTWLPDAMAGPTPVSALIHAATMVVAGVYMVARLYGVFFEGLSIGTSSINLLAVVGGVTVLVRGACWPSCRTTSRRCSPTPRSPSSATWSWRSASAPGPRHVPPLHPRLLQGLPVPRAPARWPRRAQLRHEEADMGGLRKFMPRPTGRSSSARSRSSASPARRLLVEGRDPRRRPSSSAATATTTPDAGHGLLGAAPDRRLHDPLRLPHLLRRVPGPRPTPARVGPRITVPLYILAGLAVVAGFANLPDSGALSVPESWRCASSTTSSPRPPTSRPSSSPPSSHPWFFSGSLVSTVIASRRHRCSPTLWYFKGLGPHGLTERNRARPGRLHVLENKYYLDHLYTDVIAGGVKGPIARAAYWFNQNVHRRRGQRRRQASVTAGTFVYDKIDQGVVDGVVNGSGHRRRGQRPGAAPDADRQGPAVRRLLFAAAAVLAGVFFVIII
jgi:NADH-quinone oxidoreductase subunit L